MGMTLTDWASLATVISSLAVLVSLVYVSLQLRQTERNQRAVTDQGAQTRNTDINVFLAQPQINALITRVNEGDTNFTAEELTLLHARLRVSLLTGQDMFVQSKSQLIDPVTIGTRDAVLRFILAQPVYRALWVGSRLSYAEDWRAHVDKLIANLPLTHAVNLVDRFQHDLAKVIKDAPPHPAPPLLTPSAKP
jgi:hypothetical protein